jgi:cell fate (sporulation/competence/biofilm development) regulator YlbF (YheA/YmcA/DUF963 family)
MGIDDVMIRLVEAIKTSPEFSRLKQAKSVISKNPNLKREIEEFTLSQKQLFSGKLPVKEAESRIKQLDTKLESLSKIPEVRNYLEALNALNQMMAKINYSINEFLEKSLQ